MDVPIQNNWIELILLILWALPWKGFALWRAAKVEHKRWFIALLVLNTLAAMDILYLFLYNKSKEEKTTWLVKFIKENIPFFPHTSKDKVDRA